MNPIKQLLIELLPDIENIDSGCSDCISSFLLGVNETLVKYKFQIKPTIDEDGCTDHRRLTIIEL
jgi:hypothetical protein